MHLLPTLAPFIGENLYIGLLTASHPLVLLFNVTNVTAGERTRIYTCCSLTADGHAEGCTRGPHVFYESDPCLLHTRHPFSESAPMTSSALDVAALDCEMIYSTGGFRIARVSVVDASGKEMFDELIKMDEDVEVVCVISLIPASYPLTLAVSAAKQ
jgi:hypothetical protein